MTWACYWASYHQTSVISSTTNGGRMGCGWDVKIIIGIIYHLDIQHSHGKWPIEIDGLAIKNGRIFHGKL